MPHWQKSTYSTQGDSNCVEVAVWSDPQKSQ